MGKRESILNPQIILERIEKQLESLGMSKQDLSTLTYIPYPTLINNFQIGKIPMFDDLFRISLALGIPISDLIAEEEPDYTGNSNNILYWKKYIPVGHFRNSFMLHIQDKIALAKAFQRMSETTSLGFGLVESKQETPSIEELRFHCFFHTLNLYRVDSVFIFSKMSEMVNSFYSNNPERLITLPEYRTAQNKMTLSLWAIRYLPTQTLWAHISKRIPEKFPTLSAFLKEAKLNSQTYGKYLNAVRERSTPSTESVYRICKLLDTQNLDEVIRANLPPIPEQSTNSAIYAGVIPHTIENDILKETLKPLPYLAMFYDCVFSLNYESLSRIHKYVMASIQHPFHSPDYLTVARPSGGYSEGIARVDQIGIFATEIKADYQLQNVTDQVD